MIPFINSYKNVEVSTIDDTVAIQRRKELMKGRGFIFSFLWIQIAGLRFYSGELLTNNPTGYSNLTFRHTRLDINFSLSLFFSPYTYTVNLHIHRFHIHGLNQPHIENIFLIVSVQTFFLLFFPVQYSTTTCIEFKLYRYYK
jgi:hypothetical protein